MKKIFFAVLLFSLHSSAQQLTTISGNGKKLVVADMTGMGRLSWGGYEQIGAAARSEKDGEANTRAIVASVGKNTDLGGKPYAAKVCDTLTLGGYTDWYLPCQEETNIIHLNFKQLKLDEKMTLWSSTEASGTQAVTKYLYSGAFYNVAKIELNHFVCVRKSD